MSETSEDTARADAQRAALGRLAELEASNGRLFAARMRVRAEMDSLWNAPLDGQEQFGVLELAGTARIGLGRAASQLSDGTKLVTELTGTLAGLEAGTVFEPTAVLLLQMTRNCSTAVTIEVERRVLPLIASMNTTDARRIINETIPQVEADLSPEATQERLDHAAGQARVWQRDLGDGMVELGACLDVLSGKRWALDFDELVRAQRVADKRAGIVRTAEQRRAAVFAQLPSRLLALIRAIQTGQINDLLALAQADPTLAENLAALQELAAQAPPDLDATPSDAADVDHEASNDAADDDDVHDAAAADVTADGQPEGDGTDINGGWPEQCPFTADLPPRPESSAGSSAGSSAEERPGYEPEASDATDSSDSSDSGLSSAPDSDPPEPLGAQPRPDPYLGAELCPEAAFDTARDPDPPPLRPEPDPPGAWTRDPIHELVVQTLMLPVKDPKVLIVHAPMSTLAELDNRPGTLDGNGAVIPAFHIRLMAPTMTWRRLVCDADSGNPLGIDPVLIDPVLIKAADAGLNPSLINAGPHFSRLEQLLEPILLIDQAENQHDPSTALRELVMLRDQRCIGIGCSLPAWRCHLDHEIPYPQGPTAAFDLSAKSTRCHRAKHAGWTVTRPDQGPASRTITWTSPLGHSYTRPTRWATIENTVHGPQGGSS